MFPRKLIHESDEGKLYDHFLVDIVGHDRYLRFGYMASNDNIQDYLQKAFDDYGNTNMWFICLDDDKVVGSVHVARTGDTAEMGFTVNPEYRGKGLGQDLFMRGATWAQMKGVETIYTQCLSENEVMQHIAKKNGMTVVTIAQGEKEATVKATKGIIQSYFYDKAFDNVAFVDWTVSKQQQTFNKLMGLR